MGPKLARFVRPLRPAISGPFRVQETRVAGASRRTFICQRGLSWGPNGEHAYEPGDVITDLPAEFVGWMLDQGVVREADETRPKRST